MKPMDWQSVIPRSPEVSRVQQAAEVQGQAAQEHLDRVARAREQRAPRVKDATSSPAVRDRREGRPRGQRRRQEGKDGADSGPHLDVRV
ncbi:MAG: hypothetical protein QME70_10825 [Bacillota bacterium]|nr:hypothetical protein [Bacillota bacterium]